MWHFNPVYFDYEDNEDTLPGIGRPEKGEKIELPDGSYALECTSCHQQHRWAEPNQKDGSFVCYECRNLWKSKEKKKKLKPLF